MMEDIKLIIFDLDGTLYSLDDVAAMNYQMQVNFYTSFTGISAEKAIKVFGKNDIYPVMNEKSKSATEFFIKSGIPAYKWNKYREKHFDVTSIRVEAATHPYVISDFRKICPLVLLSSNATKNIKKILKHINIDTSSFDEIICSDNKFGQDNFTKFEEMRLMLERRNISSNMVLSIGDRKRTDVDPILQLGGHGIVVEGPYALEGVVGDILNKKLDSSNMYKYY